MVSVCVFCGSQPGNDPLHLQAARQLGIDLANEGHTLVYGGGSVGMMGAIADSMLQRNGTVIGVIPEALANVEMMHSRVTDMRIVADMHIRKATMHALADCYLALPGGYGTMEELFEALCWAQLEFHSAPVALLNIAGVYDGLLKLIDDMTSQGFLTPRHREILSSLNSVEAVNEWLQGLS